MSHIRNLTILNSNTVSISGSQIQLTGSVYGSQVSGTVAQFTTITGSNLVAGGVKYPTSDGDTGQILVTDGVGNLGFQDITMTINVKNLEATTITKGTPLYVTASGTSGNIAGVYRADAGNDNRMPAACVANQDISAGAEGLAILSGFINGVNTSTFASGEEVYVAVGGGYTNVRPTGSAKVQPLGYVEKVDAAGSGVVRGPGHFWELPNITAGHFWVGASNGVPTTVASSSFAKLADDNVFTGTNTFENITADTITAREYYTELVTASVIYESGSTKFGDDANDVHQFSGSIQQSGSVANYFLGNVGIGTGGTTPGELLDVRSSVATAGEGARIGEARIGTWVSSTSWAAFAHNSVYDTANSYALLQSNLGETLINAASSRSIRFRINNSSADKMVISSTGYVGIGTTTPQGLLSVTASSSDPAVRITQAGTGPALLVEDSTNPDSTPFVVDNSGNVGIGTTSPGSYKLNVNGAVRGLRFHATSDPNYYLEPDNTSYLYTTVFTTTGTAFGYTQVDEGVIYGEDTLNGGTFEIVATGASHFTDTVGIGTNSPNTNVKLQVVGPTIFGANQSSTHQFTGSVYITGSTVTLTGGTFNGNGSNLTNINANNISAGTLAVARGGTGQTSYTNGELLIGNSTGNTLSKATLTQGTGITITNGTGSITVGLTNNSVTIGDTPVSLGATVTTFTGLDSVTSTGFTGSLNGNADTATSATTATNVALTETNTTNASHFITFVDTATGNENIRTDTDLTYNPSSNTLTVGTLVETSTREIKENIKTIPNQLKNLKKLNPVRYNKINSEREEIGLIAEEVEEVYPEFVHDKGINYPKMVSVLISAVQELTTKVEKQQREITSLKKKIKS